MTERVMAKKVIDHAAYSAMKELRHHHDYQYYILIEGWKGHFRAELSKQFQEELDSGEMTLTTLSRKVWDKACRATEADLKEMYPEEWDGLLRKWREHWNKELGYTDRRVEANRARANSHAERDRYGRFAKEGEPPKPPRPRRRTVGY